MAPSFRALIAGRRRRDTFVWIASLAIAAAAIVRASWSGAGWGWAIAFTVMAALLTMAPLLVGRRQRRQQAQRNQPDEQNEQIEQNDEERRARLNGTLTIDDWGVTRVAGDIHEAVAWDDLVWVAIQTTDEGPWAEDFFYLLGGADGKGCAVSNWLAVRAGLLAALQERLPGIDNKQVAVAAGATTNATFTIWKRQKRKPGGPPPPSGPPN